MEREERDRDSLGGGVQRQARCAGGTPGRDAAQDNFPPPSKDRGRPTGSADVDLRGAEKATARGQVVYSRRSIHNLVLGLDPDERRSDSSGPKAAISEECVRKVVEHCTFRGAHVEPLTPQGDRRLVSKTAWITAEGVQLLLDFIKAHDAATPDIRRNADALLAQLQQLPKEELLEEGGGSGGSRNAGGGGGGGGGGGASSSGSSKRKSAPASARTASPETAPEAGLTSGKRARTSTNRFQPSSPFAASAPKSPPSDRKTRSMATCQRSPTNRKLDDAREERQQAAESEAAADNKDGEDGGEGVKAPDQDPDVEIIEPNLAQQAIKRGGGSLDDASIDDEKTLQLKNSLDQELLKQRISQVQMETPTQDEIEMQRQIRILGYQQEIMERQKKLEEGKKGG